MREGGREGEGVREVRGYEGGPQEASLKVTDDLERRGEEGRRE